MLPGFTYGGTQADQSRDASIVLATDNVVSGTQTYTLAQALDLTSKAGITVDGLFSGPSQSDHDEATEQMRTLIEQHHGTFLLQSDGDSVADLVRAIDRRQISAVSASTATSTHMTQRRTHAATVSSVPCARRRTWNTTTSAAHTSIAAASAEPATHPKAGAKVNPLIASTSKQQSASRRAARRWRASTSPVRPSNRLGSPHRPR